MTNAATPIVVVGTGVAGLCTALAAAPRTVLLIGRGHGGAGSASALAQGGIAAALGPGDSIDAHVEDTLIAGAFGNDAARVRLLVAAAPAAVAWLQAQGVGFDRDGCALHLGREGGHGLPRIVHAGGDATGARMVTALSAVAACAPHIRLLGAVDVDALLLREHAIAGVRVRGAHGDEMVDTDRVVLATGGIGALFARTTNPVGADGAGLALALAAGAQARDLEFMQFHPTALDVPTAPLPLVTEALRGAGARLRLGDGCALMEGVHPQRDLAPRDVVARQVWRAQHDGAAVTLDARRLDIDWQSKFPTVLAGCLAHGIDPRTTPIPVSVAAHFHMGGVATDDRGRTSVSGLYAVGEVACTGVHGANRLASNSLLEAVVFGRRLGAELAQARQIHARSSGAVLVERGQGLDADALRRLRDLLWHAAGPVRSRTTLEAAMGTADVLAGQGWQARLAWALLQGCLRRRVSIGTHWREDEDADEI